MIFCNFAPTLRSSSSALKITLYGILICIETDERIRVKVEVGTNQILDYIQEQVVLIYFGREKGGEA